MCTRRCERGQERCISFAEPLQCRFILFQEFRSLLGSTIIEGGNLVEASSKLGQREVVESVVMQLACLTWLWKHPPIEIVSIGVGLAVPMVLHHAKKLESVLTFVDLRRSYSEGRQVTIFVLLGQEERIPVAFSSLNRQLVDGHLVLSLLLLGSS